ncbi:MAG: DMT family transporter [Acidimicrobiia bacterium]|nr:DMT family transporter [Acidimicrobiia bacterium]
MAAAIVLALAAAAAFAFAAVAQQRATVTIPDDEALGAGFLARLVRRPLWLAGMGADVAGFALQAAALAVGTLLLVQPLLVTTVALALPMAARVNHRSLTGPEWAWTAVLAAGLIGFVVLGEPTGGVDAAPLHDWLPYMIIGTAVVSGCVVAGAHQPHGTGRSLLLAVAAGILLGVGGPLTLSVVRAFDDGLLAVLGSWELWAMAICTSYGTFVQQSSYQAGDVQTSLPAVTILKPVVAMVLGISLYQETLHAGRSTDIGLGVALVAMVVATVALGRLAAPAVGGGDALRSTEQGDPTDRPT